MTGDNGRPEWRNKIDEMVPEHLRAGLANWYLHGVPTGGFLRCVISNDLRGAVYAGSDESLAGLPDIVRWLYNYAALGICWGSAVRYKYWTTIGGFAGFMDEDVRGTVPKEVMYL